MMIRLIIIILFSSLCWASIEENLFYEGNTHMIAENYHDAVQVYETILNLGYKSSELYYNLGNAYYRLNFIGQSIWAYMNAIQLAPRNQDIKHNLSVANARIIDRIKIPETFIILDYYRLFKSSLTINEWFLMGSLSLFLVSLIFFGIKFGIIKGKIFRTIRQILIYTLLIIHIIALDSYLENYNNKIAVVLSNDVEAYSGPFYGENSILFKVNEGSVVDVSSMQKDWVEIILIDGNKGWIPKKSIRTLN